MVNSKLKTKNNRMKGIKIIGEEKVMSTLEDENGILINAIQQPVRLLPYNSKELVDMTASELLELYAKGERDFYGVVLCGVADLRNADLRGAYLSGSDLRFADLCGADLRFANLCNAYLYGVKYNDETKGLLEAIGLVKEKKGE